ncbi:MAG: hypothetical protein LBI85_08850 [Spirochaetaceae bacterium]|jgi:hypothetical protein|nr:hypothetical protein [Spirochaetaceae bacterium]
MELKNYQRNILNVLKSFFEQCRIMGHEETFKKITSEPDHSYAGVYLGGSVITNACAFVILEFAQSANSTLPIKAKRFYGAKGGRKLWSCCAAAVEETGPPPGVYADCVYAPSACCLEREKEVAL